MRATKITIYPDVKEHLEAWREREKEPFNDILRRILKMDEPESIGEPHYYEGVIKITRLRSPGLGHIREAIINNPEWDGCNMLETIKINDIDVRVGVEQKVTLVVKGKTEEEVDKKIAKVVDITKVPEINRAYIEYWIRGLTEIDGKTGKRLDKEDTYDLT